MQMEENKNLMFIINPKAGGFKEAVWEDVVYFLDQKGVDFDYYKTKCAGDATNRVPEFVKKGYRHFVAIGGDGTVSEVVNGIMRQDSAPRDEIVFSAILFGTGNDWVRNYKQKNSVLEALDDILNSEVKPQDVGVIRYYEGGMEKSRYFVNSAGFGFDAQIIKATKQLTSAQRGKRFIYLFTLLKCLITCKKINYKVIFDAGCVEQPTLSISIANGKYTGGGMQQTPDADMADGALDGVVFGNIGKHVVIRNVNRLFSGRIKDEKHKNIHHFRSEKVVITSPEDTIGEVDGELIGSGPYTIEVIPAAIRVQL